MAYDYDKLYGETRDALGPPTAEIVAFFDRYDRECARVLDVGCGQGRDAVFVARKGHRVVGADLSANGIRDLQAIADKEKLPIEGVVADVTSYTPPGMFDVVLCDRTLHMLSREARCSVLRTLLDHVSEGGWVVFADEPSNIGDFRAVFAADGREWVTEVLKRGYLFVRRG